MTKHPTQSTSALWARFRFSVVARLLSAPPARGRTEIRSGVPGCQDVDTPGDRRKLIAFRGQDDRTLAVPRGKSGTIRRPAPRPCGKIAGRCP